MGHWYLGHALFRDGQLEAALSEVRLEPIESLRLSSVALIEQARRHPDAADTALRQLLASDDPDKAYWSATVYAARGDANAAVTWLERARLRGPPAGSSHRLFRIGVSTLAGASAPAVPM